MVRFRALWLIFVGPLFGVSVISGDLRAQSSSALQFENVSIRRSDPRIDSGGIGRQPDGTLSMRGTSIDVAIKLASPARARAVVGLPGWAQRERYDITAKPPADATPEQQQQMWFAVFEDRMKLAAHVEEQGRDIYALVVASEDGHLGPNLAPSTLDCPEPRVLTMPSTSSEVRERCRVREFVGPMGGWLRAGGVPIDLLTIYLGGLAGGDSLVDNRTGLDGLYSVNLTFASRRRAAVAPDDAPDFFTALQQQLGLKLQPEKAIVPVWVIDHIERPTEN